MNGATGTPVYGSAMKLALVPLLLAGVAAADVPATTPTCAAKGTPLLEIRQDSIPDAHLPTKVTAIYDSGAWTASGSDNKGKPLPSEKGCLDEPTLAKIRSELKTATFQVRHNKIHCMMVSQTFTVYSVNGKQVWTAKVCNPDALDDASAKVLADIESALAAAKVPIK
jgi:hypothetical protein